MSNDTIKLHVNAVENLAIKISH